MKRILLLGALLALGACGDQPGLPVATALSPAGADDIGAGYSPDGSRIYWWSRAGDKWQLWESPPDLSTPRKVPILASQANLLAWSPDGSRFAIGADIGTTLARVWVVDTAGGPPRRLNAPDAFQVPQIWNRDGRRLAYITLSGTAIVAMAVDVDSGTPVRLVPGESRNHAAVWSPDGSKLAVQVFGGGQSFIELADSVGGNLEPLTTEGFEALSGAMTPWSPDGTRLLYTSTRTGAADVWVLPVDGGTPQQLTNDVRDDNSPIWSPDGEWIAFRSERGLQTDLWVMPAAGGPAERITDDVAREALIDWRPGTQELSYTTGKTSQTMWAQALADGAERQLTPDSLEASWFNVSSRSEVEVSINRGGGVFDITSWPLAGGESRTILPNAGTVSQTYWSPDGSKLAFVSDRGGSEDIWAVDATGGAPRQLTTWPEQERNPVWSADGKEVYFWANRDATWGNVWRVAVVGGPPVQVTSTGRFLGLCSQTHPSLPLLAPVLGQGPGAIELVQIGTDGSPQTVWNKSTAPCGDRSPSTDSLVANISDTTGTRVAMLLPINGGAGRQLLPAGELAAEWSPDGTQLLYGFRDGNARDYGILTLADSSTRRLTTTTADENGAEFSPDGSTIVFRRSVWINRITTANLTKLLAVPQQ